MDNTVKTHIVERDMNRPLRFRGRMIARAGNPPEFKNSPWGGAIRRWAELTLYQTEAGTYVCSRVWHPLVDGEVTSYDAELAITPEEVMNFFRFSRAAKEIYRQAGLDPAEDVQ